MPEIPTRYSVFEEVCIAGGGTLDQSIVLDGRKGTGSLKTSFEEHPGVIG